MASIWKVIQGFLYAIYEPTKKILTLVGNAQTQTISQLFAILIGRNVELRKLNENVEKTNKTIETKIIEAQESLANTSQVINELNGLIESNQKELEKVRTEYEHINKLNKLSLAEAQPLLTELDKTVKKENKKNHLISILISFLFFLAGAILGPMIYGYVISLF